MTQFAKNDRVELTEIYNDWPIYTRGTVTGIEPNAVGDWSNPLLRVTADVAHPDGRTEVSAFAHRFKKISVPEFFKGRKVRITRDGSAHGFPVDTEVYLLEKNGHITWLCSEDATAEPRWTGRYGIRTPVVMNVDEYDMSTEILAEWEKELLHPGSTDLAEPEQTEQAPERDYIDAVHYTDLRVGDTIGFVGSSHFSVYRDAEPEPEVPAVGTRGTAIVDGERIPGIIDSDGDFAHLTVDTFDGGVELEYSTPKDFEPDV